MDILFKAEATERATTEPSPVHDDLDKTLTANDVLSEYKAKQWMSVSQTRQVTMNGDGGQSAHTPHATTTTLHAFASLGGRARQS